MTLAEVAAAVDGTLHDGDPGDVVTRSGRLRLAARCAPAGSSSPSRASASTATTSQRLPWPTAPSRCSRRVRSACRASSSTTRSTRWAGWRGRCTTGWSPPGWSASGSPARPARRAPRTCSRTVLEGAGPTVAPQGSLNTEVGVPLTVLEADAGTRHLVVEMGARGPGHIAYLCGIAPPRIGVVLNVGAAHAEQFGGPEATARAKRELVEALPADGAGRAQRRRPAGAGDGAAHRGPGGDRRADRRRGRAGRGGPARRPGPPRLPPADPGGRRRRAAAPARRAPRRQRARRRRRRARAGAAGRPCGVGPVRGDATQPLADGGHAAPGRRHRRQRRLQRQPRLGAGRARGGGRDVPGRPDLGRPRRDARARRGVHR